jgi:hypothetical protein
MNLIPPPNGWQIASLNVKTMPHTVLFSLGKTT